MYPSMLLHARKACVFIAGLSVLASNLTAAVTAHLSASRTSGVAPLAVHFDASATTSTATTRPFHEVDYTWDYGDSGSGTWSTSGRSRNQDTGAIGAHLFETPGTYTVTLTARDETGATDTETVTITVTNPDVVFSGTNTICFSRDGNFAGAPAGAQQITTTNWDTIANALGTGKRVLLKRGQAWNFSGTKRNLTFNGPGILGAFGTGNRPVIRFTSAGDRVFWLGTGSTPGQFHDFRFMDLEIDGDGHERGFIWSEGTVNNVTFLRISMHDAGSFMFFAPSVLNYYNANGRPGHTLWSGIAVIDTTFDHIIGDGTEFNGRHIAYIGAQRLMFMGNTWNDAELGEHVLRLPLAQRALIAHNRLTNSRARKHVIKLHGNGSDRITIADNHFSSALGDWTISLGPQNNSSNEAVTNVVLERNELIFTSTTGVGFHLAASETTTRNNAIVLTAAGGGTVVDVTRRGIEPAPTHNRIYHNSAYNGGSGTLRFVNVNSSAANTTVRNNLGRSVGSSVMIQGTGSNLVQSNNVITATPGWVATAPTSALDFELVSTSSAIDAGAVVPVFQDYEGLARPSGAARDLGAFEYSSGGGGELLTFGGFEPNQATVLLDLPTTLTLGTAQTSIWYGRVGSLSSQNTTYQTSGANHYVTVGSSTNTNGCLQIIPWPGSGTFTLSFSYRGSASKVRIYGGAAGSTINKFNGTNTLTQLQQIDNPAASGWTTASQSVSITGSYTYLVIALRGGDFDDVSFAP